MKSMDDYRFMYPSLIVDILEFFSEGNMHRSESSSGGVAIQPRTIQDFLEYLYKLRKVFAPPAYPQPEPINAICHKLVSFGVLAPSGQIAGTNIAGLNNTYLGILKPEYDRAQVNFELSNAVYGWPCIYDTYRSSIIPIQHEN